MRLIIHSVLSLMWYNIHRKVFGRTGDRASVQFQYHLRAGKLLAYNEPS